MKGMHTLPIISCLKKPRNTSLTMPGKEKRTTCQQHAPRQCTIARMPQLIEGSKVQAPASQERAGRQLPHANAPICRHKLSLTAEAKSAPTTGQPHNTSTSTHASTTATAAHTLPLIFCSMRLPCGVPRKLGRNGLMASTRSWCRLPLLIASALCTT